MIYPVLIRFICLSATCFLLLMGCSKPDDIDYKPESLAQHQDESSQEFIFSVHPLHNPTRLHEIFGPLMEYLSGNIKGARFVLEASRNYASYDQKLYAGHAHFSLPNPFQTVQSIKHGYRIFGKMGDDDNFRGIILVRKDSGINEITDLKGKKISYPAPTALAATMMPQYYLHTHGIDVMKDVETVYVGSQESSIMNVYLGDTAAGATWPPPWQALAKERPELKQQLEVKWQTDPLPNNGLVARNDVDESLIAQVGELLFTLHTHEQGRYILERMELSKFEPANAETYQSVLDFLDIFERTVRPIN